MNRTVIAVAFALSAAGTHASTMSEYTAKCNLHLEHRFKFEGLRKIAFGLSAADAKTANEIYRITPPKGHGEKEIEVVLFPKRTATVDGVPAKEVVVVRGCYHLETSRGLDLRFTQPPKDAY
ncbi:hypothetical protein ACFJGW_00775 [Burkholderiaceae bacterium UC74_6]